MSEVMNVGVMNVGQSKKNTLYVVFCKGFVVAKFSPSLVVNFWVRCASGNV